MSEVNENNELNVSYCRVIADQIQKAKDEMEVNGAAAAFNRVSTFIVKIANTNSSEICSIISPIWQLIGSMVITLIDEVIMSQAANTAIEAASIDDGTKKSLSLLFKTTRLSDITGQGGHMIEAELLKKELPVFSELPEDVQTELLTNLRNAHQKIIRKDVPAEEEKFFDDICSALKDCDGNTVGQILLNETIRLHRRIASYRSGD